jgi:DNA-binding GntR family transcriptional regulator
MKHEPSHGPLPKLDADALRTSHEVVSASLRRAIVSGALPGGTRLVQTDLAVEMGVSTTPIREAFRDLVAEGLLEFDRYRGAIVHAPTVAELSEIYEMRIALEPMAVRRAAAGNISDAEAGLANELIVSMDATDDVAAFVEFNRHFHELLTEWSRAPRLIATLRTLRDAAALYVGASLERDRALMRSSNREHQQLLDALRAGYGDLAAKIIVRHFRATVDTIAAGS